MSTLSKEQNKMRDLIRKITIQNMVSSNKRGATETSKNYYKDYKRNGGTRSYSDIIKKGK